MLMQSAFDVNIMNTGHVNHIQTQDGAWSRWESDVYIEIELQHTKEVRPQLRPMAEKEGVKHLRIAPHMLCQ